MFNAFRDCLWIFSDQIGSEWFLKFGSDLDWIILDRIRILKFTNYWIGNFQSDPMHTFNVYHSANSYANVIINLKCIYSLFENNFCGAMIERQNYIKCSEISTH